jgi:hypothetical protein
MKQNLFLTGLLALMMMLSGKGWGQTTNIVSWNFTTSITDANYATNTTNQNAARSTDLTNVSLTSISIVGGASGVNANTFHRTTGWPTSSDNGKYLQFSITLTNGETFANQQINVSFGAQVSSTATAARDYTVTYGYGSSPTFSNATNGTVTNTGTTTTTTTNIVIPAPGNTTTTILTVRVLIYGTTSSTGNFRITTLGLTGYTPLASTPTIALNNNTQITAGNVNQGATDHLLSRFSINVATANATLNQISFAAGGTFEAGDITNFKLYTSTTNTFPGGTPLASVAAGAIANNGTVTFSSLSQACAIGDRYFWIAADVSATAGETRTVSVPSLSASNFTFALGTPTGTIDAGGAQTFVAVTPGIELSSPSPSTGDITQGISNQVVYRFDLAVTVANGVLNGVTITTAGTYIASDLTNLKCWYSADNSFNSGTDELLSTKTTSLGTGAQVFPSFSSKTINEGTTGYMFITVDLPVSATEGNTISVNAITTSDISFVSGNKSGTANASGTKTIIACTPTNVTGLGLTPGNTQIAVSWTNPACYDEVMIVAKPTSSIGASPSGDGSAYTANLAFGIGGATAFDGTGYVVYKGSTSPQTITGLANGTTYFVRVFTRKGTTWTSGEESSTIPIFASSSSDYFRSKATGDWNATGSWESSSNGSDWFNATLTPTSSANTITIRNNHTVTINANVTVDQVVIESGGVISYTAGTLTVANGTGHDIQINDGGVFALSFGSTPPSFNTDASCLISTGGMLRVAASGLTANGAGVNLANFVYQSASILEYTLTTSFSASGVTYFPNADANTIPIFRITAITSNTPGGAANLIINGIIEANSSFSWTGAGTKTFRNGIRGTGTMTQSTTGQWIISGSTAELNGSGALSLGTNGLVINSGSTVTASSIKSISGGTVTNNGTLNVTSDGALNMSALTNSATGVVNITGSATITGTLTNSAGASGLVIESDATGTGSLINSTAGVAATVQRYIPGATWTNWKDGWHALSSPVSAQDISPNFVIDPAADYDFYTWYEPNNIWVNFKNTSNAPTWNTANTIDNSLTNDAAEFLVGKGYLVAYKTTDTKAFTGTLNSDDVVISNLDITDALATKSFHLLGNPFASALQWNADWTKTNIAATSQIWNESLQDYSPLAYGDYIPAMNGFVVEVTDDDASITIPKSEREHNSTAWYKSLDNQSLKLTVMDQDNESGKETIIRFNPESTTGFDLDYDGSYLQGYGPVFYSVSEDNQLSVNTLPNASNDLNIPIVFSKNEASLFSLQASGVESMPYIVYLTDKKNELHPELAN